MLAGQAGGRGDFKTPTLRGIARTAPYMHDGSLATLEDVIDFYDRGGRPNPSLDPEIRPLRLSVDEKRQLAAFLRTLLGEVSADPAVLRQNIDETKAWVQLARDIGSPSVKVRPNGLAKGVPEERSLEQIGKALRECGAFAPDHGVKIQLEVHGETTSRLPRIREILDYGGNHPGVRVCWSSNPTDLLDGGFNANFHLVRDQIGQVHMRDLFVEEYPWRQLLTALTDMRFDGYCFAEIPESADPLRVLRYFRGLFRAYQGL